MNEEIWLLTAVGIVILVSLVITMIIRDRI